VPGEVLNRAFFESFQNAGSPAFGAGSPAEIQAKEFSWWLAIATQTFEQAGALHQFADFGEFFAALYAHFATAAPWFVYDDVKPALERWKGMGISLGVLSNFDSRIYSVLQVLELGSFFSSVTISTEAGVAKPHPQIFAIALEKQNCAAGFAWHIGDSFVEDYQAAQRAGLRGIWLRRKPS
jgi:putative hydrolase of the HAD superfamily